jgi:hypothetical protein
MCYNCGCELKDDPMGKGHVHEGGGSLTEKTFEHMAKIWSMSVEETKKEILKMLKKEFKSK